MTRYLQTVKAPPSVKKIVCKGQTYIAVSSVEPEEFQLLPPPGGYVYGCVCLLPAYVFDYCKSNELYSYFFVCG